MSFTLTTYSGGRAAMGKDFRLTGLHVLTYLCLSLLALGQGIYSGGSGSPEDPFQISIPFTIEFSRFQAV